jgi:AcrR family transcriptional regulator
MKKDAATTAGSREKLLASAEVLFSKHGYNGVSVRDIAAAAGVNSALVGYYFGGKQALLAEIYDRHAKPLIAERARIIKQLRESKQGLTLEGVLEAFIKPSLEVTIDKHGRTNFTRLRAILSGENSELLEKLVAKNYDKSTRGFVTEISHFVPHLSREEVFWRFHFLIGSIHYTGAGPQRIFALTKGACNPSDPVETAAQMVPFLAAGFRAPARPAPRKSAKPKAGAKRKTTPR